MEGTLLIDRASYSEMKERIFCKDDDGDRAVKHKGQRQTQEKIHRGRGLAKEEDNCTMFKNVRLD